ncbi:MAG: hydrolase [Candidatus Nitrosopelagicus sp.]|nr:hydrolase [Candidatus Nitrosopelagicus sp.]
MSEEKDELIKAQNEVIGVLFEIIKRFQTNNDLTDEYLKLSIKEKIESDNERLEAITKERDENANIIARLLEKLET